MIFEQDILIHQTEHNIIALCFNSLSSVSGFPFIGDTDALRQRKVIHVAL